MAQNTLTVFAKDLAPWNPDVDARRQDKPGIITGTNFRDTIDGPQSAYSSEFVNFNYWAAGTREKTTELRLTSGGMLYGTQTGVWKINPTSGIAEPLLLVTTINKFWPWTMAFVGGVYYLAQYNIGLWQYDPINETLEHVITPAGDNVSYVALSFGRLIYLTPTAVACSALDDGTNLSPSLSTAAQAQTLQLVGGTGLRIEPIPDGFLVYTTFGIMKGTYTQAAYVFAWTKLTEAVKLFTPNAGVYVPRLGAISLDNSGFNLTTEYNITNSGLPKPWEVPMGDFIRNNILRYTDDTIYGSIAMYFSQQEQLLFISFYNPPNEGLMTTTFVHDIVSQRWGSFDHQNYGIFETYDRLTNTYACSYMGIDGFMRAFSNTDFSEYPPTLPLTLQDYVYRPVLAEEQMRGVVNASQTPFYLATTDINGSDNIPTAYRNFTQPGLYEINYTPYSDTNNDNQDDPIFQTVGVNNYLAGTFINMDVSGGVLIYAQAYNVPVQGLNSTLSVGPWRFTDQTYGDQVSAVDEIVLGTLPSTNFIITEDWNILFGNEDWNVLTGNEDWNSGSSAPNVFGLTLRDSDDGISAPLQGDENLYVFNNLGSALKYSPQGYSSIFHILNLSANDPFESFALKYIDFTGLATGRLTTNM